MPPRILQWLPVDAVDEVYLVPQDGAAESFVQRASELASERGFLRLTAAREEIYASGTNIDGGWIDLGIEEPIVRLVDGSVDELARTVAELIDHIQPTRFLVRDVDGWAARAVHVAEDIEVIDVPDWRHHLVDEGGGALVTRAVTEAIDARGLRGNDLDELAQVVAIAPAELHPRLLLARLYLQLDRDADAEREARAILELPDRDYRKAPARSLLGQIATRRGDARAAFEEHGHALKLYRHAGNEIAYAVAAIEAGEDAAAWEALARSHRGRRLFELAEAMCAIGRVGDARACLRIALELDPKLLRAVPENQWPKPPAVAWTAAHPELATLVAAAARASDG